MTDKKEIQDLKEKYHKAYWEIGWKAFRGLWIVSWILQVLFILIFRAHVTSIEMIIFPSVALVVILLVDQAIERNKILIENIFFFYILLIGIIMTHEGLQYDEYKFHETWLVFYSVYLIISIATWFHWKKMVLLFWSIQLYNFVMLHITYEYISTYFYCGYAIIVILLPLIWMVIARTLLGFILMIHNNHDLIETIKKILEVFPEGIIIQSLDKDSQWLTVQFTNNTAAKEIINYEDHCAKPIDDEQLSFVVKSDNSLIESNILSQNENQQKECNLSELLQLQIENTISNQTEVVNSVELLNKQKINSDEDSDSKFYSIKTLCVKWENNKNSYIHVFNNTTTLKKFEQEKTRNECIHLMLSSISHEFRTPINAFSNSMYLLESNYLLLLQKLKEPEYTNIRDNLVHQRQIEANERFFKICKISTSNLLCLVEDILDLAKFEAGTFSLHEKLFSISSLVGEIDYIFGFQWTQKGIAFKIDVSEELMASSFCSDMGRIRQVLINLISNAFKFTMKGGITLKIKSASDFDPAKFERCKFLKFSVIDSGIGIHEKEIPKLFKLFGMVNRHRNNINSRGTGLGLSISKKIVESLGGKISLNSKLEVGTEITFTIKEQKVNHQIVEEIKGIFIK